MWVYHDTEGSILYTLTAAEGMPLPSGPKIEVEGSDLDPMRWRVVEGALVPISEMTAEIRAVMLDQIAQARGAARSRFITVLPGQDMVYLAKEAEARAWLSEPSPDLADFPMIAAEIPTTGETADQVAQVWANMAALWRTVSTIIEAATLSADASVRSAETVAAAQAAIDEMTTALAVLG